VLANNNVVAPPATIPDTGDLTSFNGIFYPKKQLFALYFSRCANLDNTDLAGQLGIALF
jgi:hypothetical protein